MFALKTDGFLTWEIVGVPFSSRLFLLSKRAPVLLHSGDGETYQNQNHMDSGNIWQILGAVVDSLGDIGGGFAGLYLKCFRK